LLELIEQSTKDLGGRVADDIQSPSDRRADHR
jgi:hypothetical protein